MCKKGDFKNNEKKYCYKKKKKNKNSNNRNNNMFPE